MKLNKIKANMTEGTVGDKTVLFSYKTPVAYHQQLDKTYVTDKFWNRTTSRHINQWVAGQPVIKVSQETLDKLI